jgi:hypothetical protein
VYYSAWMAPSDPPGHGVRMRLEPYTNLNDAPESFCHAAPT